jgi:hypothetical protein
VKAAKAQQEKAAAKKSVGKTAKASTPAVAQTAD